MAGNTPLAAAESPRCTRKVAIGAPPQAMLAILPCPAPRGTGGNPPKRAVFRSSAPAISCITLRQTVAKTSQHFPSKADIVILRIDRKKRGTNHASAYRYCYHHLCHDRSGRLLRPPREGRCRRAVEARLSNLDDEIALQTISPANAKPGWVSQPGFSLLA